jgi:hypothetical protein
MTFRHSLERKVKTFRQEKYNYLSINAQGSTVPFYIVALLIALFLEKRAASLLKKWTILICDE